MSFLQMQTAAKQRAHMENAGPLSTQEWKDNVNASARKLYRLLTELYGDEYFGQEAALVTVPNNRYLAFPNDPPFFYRLLSLWWDDGTPARKRLRRATEDELEARFGQWGWSSWQGIVGRACGVRYAVRAAGLVFAPTPLAAHNLVLKYVPAPFVMQNDTDSFLSMAGLVDDEPARDVYSGFDDFIPWDAAAAALAKEESDASFCLRMRDEIVASIRESAERDQSEPMTIQSVTDWSGE